MSNKHATPIQVLENLKSELEYHLDCRDKNFLDAGRHGNRIYELEAKIKEQTERFKLVPDPYELAQSLNAVIGDLLNEIKKYEAHCQIEFEEVQNFNVLARAHKTHEDASVVLGVKNNQK